MRFFTYTCKWTVRRTRADERAGAGLWREAGRLRNWAARSGEVCYRAVNGTDINRLVCRLRARGGETIVGDENLIPLITPYMQYSKLISHIQMSSETVLLIHARTHTHTKTHTHTHTYTQINIHTHTHTHTHTHAHTHRCVIYTHAHVSI